MLFLQMQRIKFVLIWCIRQTTESNGVPRSDTKGVFCVLKRDAEGS